MHGLSLVLASRGHSGCSEQASHDGGFSCWGAGALGHAGFSSRSTCAQLHLGMWNLLEQRIEPMSPALAGRYLTTGPSGKS